MIKIKNIEKINLKFLCICLMLNLQLFSQDLFPKIEKSLVECGIPLYKKQNDLINKKLIIETDSIVSKNYSKILIEYFNSSIETSEYQKIDSLIRKKYFDTEIISFSRTSEKYGILYMYLLKNTNGNPYFDKHIVKKYKNKNILFSYYSIMGNNRKNFEILESVMKNLKNE